MPIRACCVCGTLIDRKRFSRPPERTACSYKCAAQLSKGAPTDERVPWDEVRADAANGMTIDEIAAKYRVSNNTLKKYNIQRTPILHPDSNAPVPAEWREDAQAYVAGASILKLAIQRGVDKTTMRGRLERVGVEIRAPGANSLYVPEDFDLRVYLNEHFVTAPEAAKLLEIDHSTFAEALREDRVADAFQWGSIWFIKLSSVAEYDLRRRGSPNYQKRKGKPDEL